MHNSYETIRAFNEISWSDFVRNRSNTIKREIESKEKEYILGVDEEEYKNHLFEKYRLEPLGINPVSESIDEPRTSKEWFEDRIWHEKRQQEVYIFTVRYTLEVLQSYSKYGLIVT